jgi:hypothetical protein
MSQCKFNVKDLCCFDKNQFFFARMLINNKN